MKEQIIDEILLIAAARYYNKDITTMSADDKANMLIDYSSVTDKNIKISFLSLDNLDN